MGYLLPNSAVKKVSRGTKFMHAYAPQKRNAILSRALQRVPLPVMKRVVDMLC